MKKIININLSGRVIPIEDSAYETLQAYIESLRRYFANEEGRDEIINDIESRIAELLHEKVRKGAEAVTDADVQEVIASMGRVEDFEAEAAADAGEQTNTQQSSQPNFTYGEKKSKGRLYRDTSDKFIGGVCSGIASYMNVDPAIVRILFAIITFGGFGLGFLAYIILWAILPPKDLEGYHGKRLYRNPDDRVIGGVAGGLAAYFDKSASTIRLIFAIPLLLSVLVGILNGFSWSYDFDIALNIGFGSLTGTFFLIYVILWMVLPEANTDYQKMEMRGEKVDVNRIRQNVKEGMDTMKGKMKGWTEEVKASAQNMSAKAREFSNTRGKAFAAEVSETFSRKGSGIGHAIGVLFKVFFLFIAGSIAFGLFVGLIALLFGGIAWWPVNNFLWTSKWQQVYAWGTLFFFLIVPLIAFITWVVRRLMKVKSRSNYLGWTFGGLWTIGWVFAVLLGSSLSKDFRYYRTQPETVAVAQPANGKMIIAVSQPELEYTGNFGWIGDGGYGWDLSSDTLSLAAVKFTVKKSVDSAYHVVINKSSCGKTIEEAFARAAKIQFNVLSRDSILDVGNGYSISKDSKFRGQNIEVEIHVPAGKKVRFDESVREKLNSIHVRVKKDGRRRRITGVDISNEERDFNYRINTDYIMGEDGVLKDEKGNAVEKPVNNDYKYNAGDTATNSAAEIQKQLEEANRKAEDIKKADEENKRRIKDLEEKAKASKTKPTVLKKVTGSRSEETFAGGPSPVSSLVEWF